MNPNDIELLINDKKEWREWKRKCIDDDRKRRKYHMEELNSRNTRHKGKEKMEQLMNIGKITAYVAGFLNIAECNLNMPSDLLGSVLIIWGTLISSITVTCILSMAISLYLLIAVSKYNFERNFSEQSFLNFWSVVCHPDWLTAYRCFSYGSIGFLLLETVMPWIMYWPVDSTSISFWFYWEPLAGSMSAISIITLIFFLCRTYQKWGDLLAQGVSFAAPLALSYDQEDSVP